MNNTGQDPLVCHLLENQTQAFPIHSPKIGIGSRNVVFNNESIGIKLKAVIDPISTALNLVISYLGLSYEILAVDKTGIIICKG
jgi:hypothetical protein